MTQSKSTHAQTLRTAAIVLFFADALALSSAMPASIWLRHWGEAPEGIVLGFQQFGVALIAWRIAAAYLAGVYDVRLKFTWIDHVFAGSGAALLGVIPGYFLLALVQLYGFSDVRVSRAAIVIDIAIIIAWFALSRGVLMGWLRARGKAPTLIIIGTNEECRAAVDEVQKHGPAGVTCIAWDSTALGRADIDARIESDAPDHIILIQESLSNNALRSVLHAAHGSQIETYLLPRIDQAALMMGPVVSVAGLPLIPLQRGAGSLMYRAAKRFVDLVLGIALFILTLPILIVAILSIRITSSGKAIYAQQRIGRFGRAFNVYKLRTMRADAEADTGPVLATAEDDRIIPVGRVLRRWRIDEVPQLWNVICGDMSLVGPRPERKEFVDTFLAENPLYERRLTVRPGLTGLAQIHGRYDSSYDQKLRYDLLYINSASFLTDLRILFATVQTVITGHGAI